MTGGVLVQSTLPLPLVRRGKVREVYAVDDATLLLVASDRVSAFDVVMRERIPHKGAVLTQLTAWWLRQFAGIVRHHMLSADVDKLIATVPSLAPHRAAIAGRTMLCRRTQVFPVECVVRGYLSGSAWKEYRSQATARAPPRCPRPTAPGSGPPVDTRRDARSRASTSSRYATTSMANGVPAVGMARRRHRGCLTKLSMRRAPAISMRIAGLPANP